MHLKVLIVITNLLAVVACLALNVTVQHHKTCWLLLGLQQMVSCVQVLNRAKTSWCSYVASITKYLHVWTFPNDLLPAILLHPVEHCKTGNGWMSVSDPLPCLQGIEKQCWAHIHHPWWIGMYSLLRRHLQTILPQNNVTKGGNPCDITVVHVHGNSTKMWWLGMTLWGGQGLNIMSQCRLFWRK